MKLTELQVIWFLLASLHSVHNKIKKGGSCRELMAHPELWQPPKCVHRTNGWKLCFLMP